MKKRFIVLIDFSDHSKFLLQLAYDWAKKADIELLLVNHTMQPVPALGDHEVISSLKESTEQQALKDLRHFAQTAVGDDPLLQYLTSTSHLVSVIEELQSAGTADYVFVGLNDKTVFDKLLFGSTAAELSKQLQSVIFAFPTIVNQVDLSKVYIGVNERFPLNKAALQSLLQIKQEVIQQFSFFSIVKEKQEAAKAEESLQALMNEYQPYIHTSYEVLIAKDPPEAVKNFMLNNEGILAIQKGPRALADIFRPFFTTEMIYMAKVPLIILPNDSLN